MEAAHIEKTGPAERIIYGSLPKPADAEALVPVKTAPVVDLPKDFTAVISCRYSRFALLSACLGMTTLAGCSSTPPAPPRFQIDPQAAAQEAIKLYDTNGDGKLDAEELKASPPLEELLKNVKAKDPSHPDCLTAADISQRVDEWLKAPATLRTARVTVLLDDKPLSGATVEFEPEPFMGHSYHKHQGQTNEGGGAVLDAEMSGYPGIYVGLYRVRISKKVNGKESLPERYNAKSVLGIEFSTLVRDPRTSGTFQLASK